MLCPNSMIVIRAAMNRTLISSQYSRNINIISDREFSTSNDRFSTKCESLCKTNNQKPRIESCDRKS